MNLLDVDIKYYDSIEQVDVEWLWYPYIPFGKVTVMQGDPGDGKTMLALNIAALLSAGKPMPMSDNEPICGNSIYQSSEDSVSDTIKPRLVGAGADCSKIAFIDKIRVDISADCLLLERVIKETKARLLVLDPLQAYIGRDSDLCRAGDMRYLMSGLADVAERTNCAVLAIGHMNKTTGAKDLYRGLGSIDITAAARSVLLVNRSDRDNNIRVMSQIKCSLAPDGCSIAFKIGKNSAVHFLGTYEGFVESDDDYTYMPDSKKQDIAANLLLAFLSDGAKLCSDCIAICEKVGISERTVNKAKKELGVRSVKRTDGWYWRMGDGGDG